MVAKRTSVRPVCSDSALFIPIAASDVGMLVAFAMLALHSFIGRNVIMGTKQVLLGMAEGCGDFMVRYFTIPPGGKSALDRHEHPHGVVVTHGAGSRERLLRGAGALA